MISNQGSDTIVSTRWVKNNEGKWVRGSSIDEKAETPVQPDFTRSALSSTGFEYGNINLAENDAHAKI